MASRLSIALLVTCLVGNTQAACIDAPIVNGSPVCAGGQVASGLQCCDPGTTSITNSSVISTGTGSCNAALLVNGIYVCPTGYTVSGTQCCAGSSSGYGTSTTGSTCYAAVLVGGTYICPNSLTLTGTQCCGSSSGYGSCYDKVGPKGYSDCPSRAYLCNDTLYYDIMTWQCPRTCNRCTSTSVYGNTGTYGNTITGSTTYGNTNYGTGSSGCVDLAAAGRPSDCPSLAYLCTQTIYQSLMRSQCARTCGFC